MNQSPYKRSLHFIPKLLSQAVCIGWVGFLLTGCEDPSGKVGSGLPVSHQGEILELMLYADTTFNYQVPPVTTFGPLLYAGSVGDIRCATLVKFSPDTLRYFSRSRLNSVWCELYYQPSGVIGPSREINLQARLLNLDWSEDRPPLWEALEDIVGPSLPLLALPPSAQKGRVRIVIPVEQALLSPSFTLVVTSSPSENLSIIPFGSRSGLGELRPLLRIVTFRDSSRTDTLYYTPSDDGFLFQGGEAESSGWEVSSAKGNRLVLGFNIQVLQRMGGDYHLVINSARLRLYLQTSSPSFLPPIMGFRSGYFTDELWRQRPDSASWIGISGGVAIPPYLERGFIEVEVGRALQSLLATGEGGVGLLVYSATEGQDISRSTFYGSDAPDSLKPSIHIVYTQYPR